MKHCDYMNSDWFAGLQREIANSTKAAVAKKMGIKRSRLSCVMNGLGAYGSGASSTRNIEKEYRRTYEQVECPFNGDAVGIEFCREHALCAAPTHNPRQMMQWQACQKCTHKPKPLAEAAPKKKALTRAADAAPVQQAGIIDKFTLPLPIVGGPQIQTTQEPA
jgi:hypothetical protein